MSFFPAPQLWLPLHLLHQPLSPQSFPGFISSRPPPPGALSSTSLRNPQNSPVAPSARAFGQGFRGIWHIVPELYPLGISWPHPPARPALTPGPPHSRRSVIIWSAGLGPKASSEWSAQAKGAGHSHPESPGNGAAFSARHCVGASRPELRAPERARWGLGRWEREVGSAGVLLSRFPGGERAGRGRRGRAGPWHGSPCRAGDRGCPCPVSGFLILSLSARKLPPPPSLPPFCAPLKGVKP